MGKALKEVINYHLSKIRRQAQEGTTNSEQAGQPISHPLCGPASPRTRGTYSPSPDERFLVEKCRGHFTPSPKSHTSPLPMPCKLLRHTTSGPEDRTLPRISKPGLGQSGGVLSSCQCLWTYLNIICYCGLRQQPQLKPKQNLCLASHGSKDFLSPKLIRFYCPTPYTFLTGPDWSILAGYISVSCFSFLVVHTCSMIHFVPEESLVIVPESMSSNSLLEVAFFSQGLPEPRIL